VPEKRGERVRGAGQGEPRKFGKGQRELKEGKSLLLFFKGTDKEFHRESAKQDEEKRRP